MDNERAVIRSLLSQFGISDCLSIRKNAFPIANDSYHVATASNSRYVLRVLRTQTPLSAANEHLIQQRLHDAGLVVPLYLPTLVGDIVANEGSIYCTLSEEIKGDRPERPSIALSRSIGMTLGRVHDALDTSCVPLAFNAAQWLHPRNVELSLSRCSPARQRQLHPLLAKGLRLFHSTLPKALIHGDLMLDNIFADSGEVTAVFDFETVEHSYRILDLARSYLSLAYDGSLDGEEILLDLWRGYDEGTQLSMTADEKAAFLSALQFVSVACAAWLDVNGGAEFVDPYLSVLDRTNL